MIDSIRHILEDFLRQAGLTAHSSERLAQVAVVAGLLCLSLILAYFFRKIFIPRILHLVEKSSTKWDDYLINRPVLSAISQLIPCLLVYVLLPLCFDSQEAKTFVVLYRLTQAYITVCAVFLITTFLRNLSVVAHEELKEHHLAGILQFLRLLTYCMGGIVMVSLLFGYNPIRVIAGLGAAATVLMLIFKDSILGLVAGIQLSVNKMLKIGDWITIDKLGINGHVEEISLTTVKVRNFDNTISTVPPYTLVSDSFQNWDGVFVKGARRVKRAFYIDLGSVRFATKEEREQLKRKKWITKEEAELDNVTNLTLLRHHLMRKLRADAGVSDQQWVLVRQLDPTPNGLPLECWFYALETEFVKFEDFAAEHMEQIIALIPEFGLRLFQAPTGADFQGLLMKNQAHV